MNTLIVEDVKRELRANLSHLRCARTLMPELPNDRIGRYLTVIVENRQLVIEDTALKFQCEL